MSIVRTMVTLDHPSIVPLKYFFMSPNHFYFITSATNSGTIQQNILESMLANQDTSKPLSHSLIKAVVKDVLMALQFMHSKGISHLELSHKHILSPILNSAVNSATSTKVQLTGFGYSFGYRKKNYSSQSLSSVRPNITIKFSALAILYGTRKNIRKT